MPAFCIALLSTVIFFHTEFDRLVSENKDAADEALKKVPEIENMIQQAINTAQEARDALQGAEYEAKEGLRLAQLAEDTATQASNVGVVLWGMGWGKAATQAFKV